MNDLPSGVFATRDDYWTPHNLLEPIVEERSSRREGDLSMYNPAAKRLRTGFECERCGRPFTEKRSLARHLRHVPNCNSGQQSSKGFPCDHCSKSFTRDDVRQRHVKEKHLNIKRRSRGLGFFPNLRPGSTNHSGPRSIAPAPYVNTQTQGATTGPCASRAIQENEVRDLLRGDGSSDFGTSSPISLSSFTESRIESNASPTNRSIAYRRRESNSSGSDMSVGSSLKRQDSNTPFTSYSSEVDQFSVFAETCGSETRDSHDGDWPSPRRVSFDLSSRELIKGGANARPASHRKVKVCPLCNKSFGTTMKEVRAHCNHHSFEGQHKCEICKIGFVHKADLNHHLSSARQGSCGLLSQHMQGCAGHHPPILDTSSMTDHDRIKLEYCIHNWEQAQLQDFIKVVQSLIDDLSSKSVQDDSWSVDGAFQKSIQSLSIRFSGLDIRSTPEYMGQHVRTAMHRVRRLVGNRVPFGPDASFKISLGKKSAVPVRLGRSLVEAAAVGDLQQMRDLILRGAPINDDYVLCDDMAACTPLMAAVCGGYSDAVELLLKNKAAVDGLCDRDEFTVATPLCLAAADGNIDIVQKLLNSGADVNKQAQKMGGHAACYAARHGHTAVLSLLLEWKANIHLHAAVELLVDEINYGSAPLSSGNLLAIAVYHNRLNTVKMILARPQIDFDYCDISSALATAAYQGNLETVELLLATHPYLCTFFALWIADSQGHIALVDAFIDHQSRIKPQLPLQSPKILVEAIEQGEEDLVSLMLSPYDGANEQCDEDVFECRHYESKAAYKLVAQAHPPLFTMDEMNLAMALNCAIYYRNLEAAYILLQSGLSASADIYPSTWRYLVTNLTFASRIGDADMVDLLLQCGANSRRSGTMCPEVLEAALRSDSNHTVGVVLNAGGCFIFRQDTWSCSSCNAAIQRLIRMGATDMLKTLIDGGLDVNQLHVEEGSNRKTTLLHLAAGCFPTVPSYETMKLLLETGADPRIRISSRTASDVMHAFWVGQEGSAETLRLVKLMVDMLDFWERRTEIAGGNIALRRACIRETGGGDDTVEKTMCN